MAQIASRPRYSHEEFAQRGHALYAQDIAPQLTEADAGKFVAIDIESGAYEVDMDDYTVTARLRQRVPTAQMRLARVGHPTAYRLGWVPKAGLR